MTISEPSVSVDTASPIDNLRVSSSIRLTSPLAIKADMPAPEAARATVQQGRADIDNILYHKDHRLLVVVGPCSIHDPKGALDYARRLADLNERTKDRVVIVMRVYFEKPRTTTGWKGLINDPHLDGSLDVAEGLRQARRLLIEINELGLPTATEFLDPIVPQYTSDLISWAAIGARTTESQTHRQMASGLSMPVGFKNGTDGSIQTALDALKATRAPHSFLGIDDNGFTSVVTTTGNPDAHLVLRGGRSGPNYEPEAVDAVVKHSQAAGVERPALMIDCSHANSQKIPERQMEVWRSILEQRASGNDHIIGAMIESYIHSGAQKLPDQLSDLKYGVSITDACISWEETEALLSDSR